MNRELCWVVVLLIAIAFLACGCQEEAQWGKGDLPPAWQEIFGDDNGSRMDFVQVEAINKHAADANDLTARIEQLESLNAEQHTKMGETDIRFHNRITTLRKLQEVAANQIGETIALLIKLAERVKALEAIDPNALAPVTHCNEPWGKGCAFGYHRCSLHSPSE